MSISSHTDHRQTRRTFTWTQDQWPHPAPLSSQEGPLLQNLFMCIIWISPSNRAQTLSLSSCPYPCLHGCCHLDTQAHTWHTQALTHHRFPRRWPRWSWTLVLPRCLTPRHKYTQTSQSLQQLTLGPFDSQLLLRSCS